MRRFSLVAVFVLVASAASAQSTVIPIDLSVYNAATAKPVDDDGNPATEAWLLSLNLQAEAATGFISKAPKRQLIVRMPNGSLCAEEPFVPADAPWFSVMEVETVGPRDFIFVYPTSYDRTKFIIVSIDRKKCTS